MPSSRWLRAVGSGVGAQRRERSWCRDDHKNGCIAGRPPFQQCLLNKIDALERPRTTRSCPTALARAFQCTNDRGWSGATWPLTTT